ncbi:hypothetical protein N1851_024130 [Merluccius polli]|uniref:Myb/SANT-like DNA-binding domain-containing protein n=1 Tax=Merluccius polli TaxID=89951 RepID=A0AA47NW55_MERPO|nr:hypothetical protein N1851_024130 [Merluccius polli]
MTTEKKRSTYFSAMELEVLMLAYGEYDHIFRRNTNTAAAAKERETAWEKKNCCPSQREKRTWKQLKMKHKNIIQKAIRKKAEARKMGGGPPPPPLTEAEELALSQNRGRPVAEVEVRGWAIIVSATASQNSSSVRHPSAPTFFDQFQNRTRPPSAGAADARKKSVLVFIGCK